MDPNSALILSQLISGLSAFFAILVVIVGVAFAVRRSMRKKELAEAELATAKTRKTRLEAQKLMDDSVDEPNVTQITRAYQRLMESHVSTIESHEHTIQDMELRIRNLEAEVTKLWAANTKLTQENINYKHVIASLQKENEELEEKMENYRRFYGGEGAK